MIKVNHAGLDDKVLEKLIYNVTRRGVRSGDSLDTVLRQMVKSLTDFTVNEAEYCAACYEAVTEASESNESV